MMRTFMSFTWLNKQGVKSNKGFIVQGIDRFTAEYLENNKKITIDLENGKLENGKYCEIIRADSFCKWDDGSYISETKQIEILENFKAAMEFQGLEVIIDKESEA